jgi:hypothetical protein
VSGSMEILSGTRHESDVRGRPARRGLGDDGVNFFSSVWELNSLQMISTDSMNSIEFENCTRIHVASIEIADCPQYFL